jgi:diguanylate cyclase
MGEIAASAARTGQAAGTFGQQLEGLSGALVSKDSGALAQHVDAAMAGTRQMRSAVQALREKVAASQAEVEALRADLLRTRQEATLCPLTRVLNRRGFDERLSAMLEQLPPKGSQHCLIMLDIDHFKRVNDTHGHLMGDRVIEGLGAVLRSVPAEPGMTCARYGGEEFAILLPSTTLNKAAQVAEDVCNRARGMRLKNRATGEVKFTITVSAGVAAWKPGEDADSLVSGADAALYRSKQNGRDRVTVA